MEPSMNLRLPLLILAIVIVIGGAIMVGESLITVSFKAGDAATSAIVNVRNYGARGDGMTDDAPAIQNALNSLPVTGGTVYIPVGTYMLGTSAGGVGTYPNGNPIQSALIVNKNNVTITGDGSVSVLKLMGNKKMRVISANHTENTTIEKILVDGNKSNRNGTVPWPNGDVVDGLLYGNHVNGMKVQNCEIKNGIEDGVGFWLGNDSVVQNCNVHDNGTAQAGAVGISLSGGSRNKAILNTSQGNSAAGIAVGFESTDTTIQNNILRNNLGEGIVVGLEGASDRFTVTGNTLEGNGASGFAALSIFSSYNGNITQNTINNNVYFGIHVSGASSVINMVENIVRNNGASIADQIKVESSSSVNSNWQEVNTTSFTSATSTPTFTPTPATSENIGAKCAIPPAPGRLIYKLWDGNLTHRLPSRGGWQKNPINVNVPAGAYKVILDGYDERPEKSNQLNEKFTVRFRPYGAPTVELARTGASYDIPSGSKHSSLAYLPGTLTLPSGVGNIYAGQVSSTDDLIAMCIGLDKI